jgi:hypothetical protein
MPGCDFWCDTFKSVLRKPSRASKDCMLLHFLPHDPFLGNSARPSNFCLNRNDIHALKEGPCYLRRPNCLLSTSWTEWGRPEQSSSEQPWPQCARWHQWTRCGTPADTPEPVWGPSLRRESSARICRTWISHTDGICEKLCGWDLEVGCLLADRIVETEEKQSKSNSSHIRLWIDDLIQMKFWNPQMKNCRLDGPSLTSLSHKDVRGEPLSARKSLASTRK